MANTTNGSDRRTAMAKMNPRRCRQKATIANTQTQTLRKHIARHTWCGYVYAEIIPDSRCHLVRTLGATLAQSRNIL